MSVLTPIDFCHAWAIFGPLVDKSTRKGELVNLPVSDTWGLSSSESGLYLWRVFRTFFQMFCRINLKVYTTGWERERLSVSNAPVFVSLIPGWTNFALGPVPLKINLMTFSKSHDIKVMTLVFRPTKQISWHSASNVMTLISWHWGVDILIKVSFW